MLGAGAPYRRGSLRWPPHCYRPRAPPLIAATFDDEVALRVASPRRRRWRKPPPGKNLRVTCGEIVVSSSEGESHHAAPYKGRRRAAGPQQRGRSEDHTSELQSQSNLVCRLLLEKKKNNYLVEL